MSNRLKEFATNVWTVDGPTVSFFGFPYPKRMAVLRLVQRDDPCAWIWSPIERSDELAKEVEAKAGPIKFIVSPNKFHHFFLKSWADKYPSAEVWGPPGLKRRKVAEGIRFNQTFGEDEHPEPEFLSEIDYVVVKGSYVLHEVEFFHKPSKTAIINDLIQRHTENLNGWKGFLMKLDGLAGEHGSTPRDWRFTFWPFGKAELIKSRDAIFGWNAEKLIISHGLSAERDASTVIQKALYWV